MPAQPVVVDGCGEHTAPVFKTESSQWKVSPTAIWTAIPRELADIRNPEQLPEKTKCRKEEGEWLKQNCEERVREEYKHESQEQIKMYQALEPIPESDGHGTNYDETLSKEGGNKPKALPLKVTPTVRQHLAKISAASVTQKHLASRKSESMLHCPRKKIGKPRVMIHPLRWRRTSHSLTYLAHKCQPTTLRKSCLETDQLFS